MKKTRKEVYDYVMSDLLWKCDLPAFLKECQLCSQGNAYDVCWNLLRRILVMLTERAIELNDPILNIIMLNLSLYEGSHSKNVNEVIKKLREQIRMNYEKDNRKTREGDRCSSADHRKMEER